MYWHVPTVKIGKKVFKLPKDWTVKMAKEIMMIEVPAKKVDTIFVPISRIEAQHWVAPLAFSEVLGMRLKLRWDDSGNVVWTENLQKVTKKKTKKVKKVMKSKKKK